jgi:hypothetical protein
MKTEEIKSLLDIYGFKKRGNKFFLLKNSIIYYVETQKSNFCEKFFINVSILFNEDIKLKISFRVIDENKSLSKDLFSLDDPKEFKAIKTFLERKLINTFLKFDGDQQKIKEYLLTKPGVILNTYVKSYLEIKEDGIIF